MTGNNLARAVEMAAEGLTAVAGGDFLLASSRSEAYGRLFGRDSLITSLQFISAVRLDPSLAPRLLPIVERTLRALAVLQGVMDDPWTEEEPGKIPHEHNPGSTGDFPGAYYASMDSTPLFLIALREYAAVTGGRGDTGTRGRGDTERPTLPVGEGPGEGSTLHSALSTQHPAQSSVLSPQSSTDLLEKLRAARDRALAWILERADLDDDGLVEFLQRNPERKSLINQNWKDSRDSLLAADGSMPPYPVAYAEVQAYCYRAVMGEAELRQCEDPASAEGLRGWATRLANGFERRFWLPETGCYAQALDARKQRLPDVASNAFHWLWMGPVRPRRFRRAVQRLLAPDMLTPFGLRTLSSASANYFPLRYHRGSIWPWDNWAAASALRRLGMAERADAIDAAVLRALTHVGCPAELYVYLDGEQGPALEFFDCWRNPTRSCRIQAWTVGYLVEMVARHGMGTALLERVQAGLPTGVATPTGSQVNDHI